ncbi:hypothetical protein HPB50_014882 [Hyalomma asiaticum]|uniref:Uncharacterized protein n=1 Tax=Hyalomma asiaticum TaxID=266040 RepID=A0ACB7T8H8_HYAAI|nr:hypothetical protein HPB50_014882 [Hyalomma asiaticum]
MDPSHAQRRRANATEVAAKEETRSRSATRRGGRSIVRKVLRASKMPRLPRDDIKIVVRPKDGLDIRKTCGTSLDEAIRQEAGVADEEVITICPNPTQNILVISTPDEKTATKIAKIKVLTINGKKLETNAYASAPEQMAKGIGVVDARRLGICVTTKEGTQIPTVSKIRVLGLWLEEDRANRELVTRLQKKVAAATHLVRRVANKRKGMKEHNGQLASCTVPVCKFARGSEAPDAVLCGSDRSLSSNNTPAPCAQKLPNHGRMYFAGVSCLVQAAPAADTPKGRKKIAKGSAGTSRYPGGQRGETLCQKHNISPWPPHSCVPAVLRPDLYWESNLGLQSASSTLYH